MSQRVARGDPARASRPPGSGNRARAVGARGCWRPSPVQPAGLLSPCPPIPGSQQWAEPQREPPSPQGHCGTPSAGSGPQGRLQPLQPLGDPQPRADGAAASSWGWGRAASSRAGDTSCISGAPAWRPLGGGDSGGWRWWQQGTVWGSGAVPRLPACPRKRPCAVSQRGGEGWARTEAALCRLPRRPRSAARPPSPAKDSSHSPALSCSACQP